MRDLKDEIEIYKDQRKNDEKIMAELQSLRTDFTRFSVKSGETLRHMNGRLIELEASNEHIEKVISKWHWERKAIIWIVGILWSVLLYIAGSYVNQYIDTNFIANSEKHASTECC